MSTNAQLDAKIDALAQYIDGNLANTLNTKFDEIDKRLNNLEGRSTGFFSKTKKTLGLSQRKRNVRRKRSKVR